ncbi:hypothetical protein ACJRPK_01890 [Aquimarina sp. 2-A2]|uniref:hypothetical protein n=1 Tax=Aquimarina sp. 2-A2 TaxID=3382644 RepID=UPI00387F2358
MSKRIIFYLPKESINEATIYYTNLLKKAFEEMCFEVIQTDNLKLQTSKKDLFFTIRIRDFISILCKKRTFKIMNWFQGITPEEYSLINKNSLKTKIISLILSNLEHLILNSSLFNVFVSDRMAEHYKAKYNYCKRNYCVIPCYNKSLQKKFFSQNYKKDLSFVYAGTLYEWQCFEETIKLYKEIEVTYPDASLTILTKDKEEARRIINEHNIKNFKVLFVSLENLDEELSKHQYGFLLRKDDIINNVATPTKMNSYLSVGVMPIFTNVIDSFNKNMDLKNFQILLDGKEDYSIKSSKVIEKNKVMDYELFYEVCNNLFQDYYNDVYYKNIIVNALKEIKC